MITMYIWDILINAFMLLTVVGTVFWIYMLVDCSTKEPNRDKMKWIVIILITNWIGALVYYFYQRPKRLKKEPAV